MTFAQIFDINLCTKKTAQTIVVGSLLAGSGLGITTSTNTPSTTILDTLNTTMSNDNTTIFHCDSSLGRICSNLCSEDDMEFYCKSKPCAAFFWGSSANRFEAKQPCLTEISNRGDIRSQACLNLMNSPLLQDKSTKISTHSSYRVRYTCKPSDFVGYGSFNSGQRVSAAPLSFILPGVLMFSVLFYDQNTVFAPTVQGGIDDSMIAARKKCRGIAKTDARSNKIAAIRDKHSQKPGR